MHFRAVDQIVSDIYDCAVDPGLWPQALIEIRNRFKAEYAIAGHGDFTPLLRKEPVNFIHRSSPWDEAWFKKMFELGHEIQTHRGWEKMDIDSAWTQLSVISEDDFKKSRFYEEWAGPQKLRDCLTIPFIRRDLTLGVVTIARGERAPLFDDEDCRLAELLTPHIRRAMAINDIIDKGKLDVALYRAILDALTTAAFVVGRDAVLRFANAAGEAMLSDGGLLKTANGALVSACDGESRRKMADAIARAIAGDAALGIRGIGVPLNPLSGERAAAYVLPIAGEGLRREVGEGAALVFLAQRADYQPAAIEILRTMFELTPAEARVALSVAKGAAPMAIAAETSATTETVRTHLKHVFAKTGANSQVALSALVNAILPPVDLGGASG